MTDYRAMCSRMADELDHYRQLLMDDRREAHALATEARTLLAQPTPQPPAAGEVAELVEGLKLISDGMSAIGHESDSWFVARAAELLQSRHPQPVAVSERPWERAGWCDEQGQCWLRRKHEEDGATWRLMAPASVFDDAMQTYYAEALPAHALPTPEALND